ncbi:DUF2807 domain-containing protein [Emcibacteraceae bacterium]|nr:DUF2807 domain-containing protein [Emcibacteraceae bacterium]
MTKYFSALFIFTSVLMIGLSPVKAEEITVKRDLRGFDKIRIDEVGIEIDVMVGEDYSIEIEGEEEIVDHLLMRVRGEKLVIYKDGDKKIWDRAGTDSPKVTITMPKFTGLDLRGAVDADIKGVDSEEVEFDLKGAGNIEVEGKCGWLILDFKGAGNIEAEDLHCRQVEVDLKGAGNIEIFASEKVDADISGMGNIEVYGNPGEVTKSDGWFSNITIH